VNHAYDNSMDVAFDGGYLGITERDVTSDRARELHLPAQSGEELVRVYKDTAADKAGLRAGDIVLDYNGQPVEGKNQLASLIRATPPGREARLGIWRGGSTHTVIVDIRQRTKGGKVFCYHPLNPATAMPGNWSVSVYWNNQPTPVFPPLAFTVVRARP
jgi:serine protease Do